MGRMDIGAETLAAIVAAAISAIAAVISGRQARSAKRQVELMQRQIDGEEYARHEANGPVFEIVSGEVDEESDVNAPPGGDRDQADAGTGAEQREGNAIRTVRRRRSASRRSVL